MAWQDDLQPASFRGVPFKVEANAYSSGRRGITYEFPKRDDTLDEDMGRRARRRIVAGYVIGPDYQDEAQALERALETEGGGLLVLPLMGQQTMRCESFNRSERKSEMGIALFEMVFAPAGNPGFNLFSEATQQGVEAQAQSAGDAIDISAGKDSDWYSPTPSGLAGRGGSFV